MWAIDLDRRFEDLCGMIVGVHVRFWHAPPTRLVPLLAAAGTPKIVLQQVQNRNDSATCKLVIEGPMYLVDWKVWDVLQKEPTVVYWCGLGMLTDNGRNFHGAHGVCSLPPVQSVSCVCRGTFYNDATRTYAHMAPKQYATFIHWMVESLGFARRQLHIDDDCVGISVPSACYGTSKTSASERDVLSSNRSLGNVVVEGAHDSRPPVHKPATDPRTHFAA